MDTALAPNSKFIPPVVSGGASTWQGFGGLLLSQEFRFATQPIDVLPTGGLEQLRHEWLYRPMGGIEPSKVFEALENDPDLCGVELRIIEAGLKWSKLNGPISINLSPHALGRHGFERKLISLVHKYDCRDVWWEVTEAWPMPNVVCVMKTLRALQATGGKIAIDDVAELSRLTQWLTLFSRPDVVKIDRSVVQKENTGLLSQIVNMAREAGCSVVVEGVETALHLSLAAFVEADHWQGYLGSRPELVDPSNISLSEKL